MADEHKGNGGASHTGDKQAPPIQAQVVAQYVKDLSFENPNVTKLLGGPGEDPNMSLEVSVNAQRMPKPDLYESAIDLNHSVLLSASQSSKMREDDGSAGTTQFYSRAMYPDV